MQVDVWVACAPPFSKLEKIKHREVLGRYKKSLVRKWKGSLLTSLHVLANTEWK